MDSKDPLVQMSTSVWSTKCPNQATKSCWPHVFFVCYPWQVGVNFLGNLLWTGGVVASSRGLTYYEFLHTLGIEWQCVYVSVYIYIYLCIVHMYTRVLIKIDKKSVIRKVWRQTSAKLALTMWECISLHTCRTPPVNKKENFTMQQE